jgi:RES domain-containing protein
MEVYRISKCKFIHQLDGFGAFTNGGRWNSKGHAVIYTAGSRALALLEALAHIERPPVANFCRMSLFIPDNSIIAYPIADLPDRWQSNPAPDMLKAIGDTFVAERGALACAR